MNPGRSAQSPSLTQSVAIGAAPTSSPTTTPPTPCSLPSPPLLSPSPCRRALARSLSPSCTSQAVPSHAAAAVREPVLSPPSKSSRCPLLRRPRHPSVHCHEPKPAAFPCRRRSKFLKPMGSSARREKEKKNAKKMMEEMKQKRYENR